MPRTFQNIFILSLEQNCTDDDGNVGMRSLANTASLQPNSLVFCQGKL